MSLGLDALAIAGGIFLGRLIKRAVHRRNEGAPGGAGRRNEGAPGGSGGRGDARPDGSAGGLADTPVEPPDARALLAGFTCQLGDVVLRHLEGDEAWLAGALVMAEEHPVIALFVGPEAQGERAVLVPGPPQTTLTWLAPVPPGRLALTPGGEPARSLELDGTRFDRTRRLPVRVERLGSGAPHVGARAILGEYAAPGAERLLVILGTDAAFAWRGVTLPEGAYEVLPGGDSTLDG